MPLPVAKPTLSLNESLASYNKRLDAWLKMTSTHPARSTTAPRTATSRSTPHPVNANPRPMRDPVATTFSTEDASASAALDAELQESLRALASLKAFFAAQARKQSPSESAKASNAVSPPKQELVGEKLRQDLERELRQELVTALRHELNEKLIPEVARKLKQELMRELKDELYAELLHDLGVQPSFLLSELQADSKTELKIQLKAELRYELKSELLSELESELHSEFERGLEMQRAQIGAQLNAEWAPRIRRAEQLAESRAQCERLSHMEERQEVERKGKVVEDLKERRSEAVTAARQEVRKVEKPLPKLVQDVELPPPAAGRKTKSSSRRCRRRNRGTLSTCRQHSHVGHYDSSSMSGGASSSVNVSRASTTSVERIEEVMCRINNLCSDRSSAGHSAGRQAARSRYVSTPLSKPNSETEAERLRYEAEFPSLRQAERLRYEAEFPTLRQATSARCSRASDTSISPSPLSFQEPSMSAQSSRSDVPSLGTGRTTSAQDSWGRFCLLLCLLLLCKMPKGKTAHLTPDQILSRNAEGVLRRPWRLEWRSRSSHVNAQGHSSQDEQLLQTPALADVCRTAREFLAFRPAQRYTAMEISWTALLKLRRHCSALGKKGTTREERLLHRLFGSMNAPSVAVQFEDAWRKP